MLKNIRLIIVVIIGLFMFPTTVNASQKAVNHQTNELILTFKGKNYHVKTENNATVKALTHRLPMKMTMKELNGNERYHYLSEKLPSNDQAVKHIKKGDIMLYKGKCIVLFYKDFNTSYKYTCIGHVENFSSPAKQLNKGKVTITLKKQE